jgi:hypothetical protein
VWGFTTVRLWVVNPHNLAAGYEYPGCSKLKCARKVSKKTTYTIEYSMPIKLKCIHHYKLTLTEVLVLWKC